MARLQKIEDADYNAVSILGCEFKKLLRETPGLENEIRSHPYVQNVPTNIRDALYGVEPKLAKHITGSRKGRKSTMWTL